MHDSKDGEGDRPFENRFKYDRQAQQLYKSQEQPITKVWVNENILKSDNVMNSSAPKTFILLPIVYNYANDCNRKLKVKALLING